MSSLRIHRPVSFHLIAGAALFQCALQQGPQVKTFIPDALLLLKGVETVKTSTPPHLNTKPKSKRGPKNAICKGRALASQQLRKNRHTRRF